MPGEVRDRPYVGPSGQTRIERARVFQGDRDPVEVEVFRVLNVAEHPELRAAALSGNLHQLEDGESLDVPFVYHDPEARQFALVIPPGARGRELVERARLLDALMEEHDEDVPDYVRHFAIVYGHQGLASHVDNSEILEVDVAELELVDAPVVASYFPRLAGLLPRSGFGARPSELAPLIDDDELWLFASLPEAERDAFTEATTDLRIQLKTVEQLPVAVLALIDATNDVAHRAYLEPTRAADGRVLELLRREFRATVVVRHEAGQLLRSFVVEAPRAANAGMILARADRAPTAPSARWREALEACRRAPPPIDAASHPYALRDEAPSASVALARLRELEAWNSADRVDEALLVLSVPRTVFELSRRQIVADALRFGLALPDSLLLQAVRFGFASGAAPLVASLVDRFEQTLSEASEHGLAEAEIESNFAALEALGQAHGTSTEAGFSYTMSVRGT